MKMTPLVAILCYLGVGWVVNVLIIWLVPELKKDMLDACAKELPLSIDIHETVFTLTVATLWPVILWRLLMDLIGRGGKR